jgi:hypothetical protein
MTNEFTDLIEQARRARDELQAEIDAAIDRHGVLCRFIDDMGGAGAVEPSPKIGIASPPSMRSANLPLICVESLCRNRSRRAHSRESPAHSAKHMLMRFQNSAPVRVFRLTSPCCTAKRFSTRRHSHGNCLTHGPWQHDFNVACVTTFAARTSPMADKARRSRRLQTLCSSEARTI